MAKQSTSKITKVKNLYKKKAKPAGISEKVIRILEIYTMIAQKQHPSVNDLIDRYGVTERTVHRYLQIIRYIDDIEYDQDREGYRFLNGDKVKKLVLSEDELLLLMTVTDTMPHFGKPFEKNLQTLLDRLIDINKLSSYKSKVPLLIKMPGVIENEKTNEYMTIISDCILSKYQIDIEYKALSYNQNKRRTVDPYGLVFYQGSWMLVGFCQLRKEIRSFLIDRIIELDRTWTSFTPIKDFDLEKYFSPSWGIHDADSVDITVRFESKISEYLLRRDKWHSSEKRTVLPSGDIELSFTVAGIEEIKRWIYSWIPHVEVIKPVWFRKQVNNELETTVKKHL